MEFTPRSAIWMTSGTMEQHICSLPTIRFFIRWVIADQIVLFFFDTQANAGAREYCYKKHLYDYFVRRGSLLHVQAMDSHGKYVTDDGAPIEFRPEQTVREVIIEVADNIPRLRWEKLVVYQGGEIIHEDVALGYLADRDGTVHLTFACVAVIHDVKARAALSRAQMYVHARRWHFWLAWRARADRLEEVAMNRVSR